MRGDCSPVVPSQFHQGVDDLLRGSVWWCTTATATAPIRIRTGVRCFRVFSYRFAQCFRKAQVVGSNPTGGFVALRRTTSRLIALSRYLQGFTIIRRRSRRAVVAAPRCAVSRCRCAPYCAHPTSSVPVALIA